MKSRHLAQLVLLLAPLSGLLACGSNGTAPASALPPDIYAVGFDTVGNLYKAVLWKNGVLTTLDSGIYGARAEAVAVGNGHVYVAGFEGSASNNNIAVLWTDGVPTLLTDGTGIGFAGGIALSGTDVYVVGSQTTFLPSGLDSTAAMYWKNGVPSVLSTNLQTSATVQGASATAISIDGSDVYIAGVIDLNTEVSPNTFSNEPAVTYWKNGVPTLVSDGTEFSQATGIAAQNGHVFVSGSLCTAFVPDCSGATYWMDGTVASLTPGYLGEASGIALAGSNIYVPINVSDSTGNTAFLWSNGTLAPISNTNQSAANSVVTYGSDVYIGGADVGGPGYWKNGTITYLTGTPTANNAVASVYAMAVVPAP